MTGACPDEDTLMRMIEGALDAGSLAEIELHVAECEKCAAVIGGLGALDASAAKPRVVGRYQLDRRIAAGGMGEVWAAWDPQLRREIAVKLVRPERADDTKERERLLREARALARLAHPNVLAVYDVGEIDGEVFIATELVAGDTLASRGGATCDWRALARQYAQAARGLHAAHLHGLVHRDVKPANLLLGADGRVRVADFGLAIKRIDTPSPSAATELASSSGRSANLPRLTATGHVVGTPAYMAPEQRAGQPPDARADQYALCVALVEGIAGRRPVGELGRDAMIAFVSERRGREPELDRLCGVLAKGLAREPTARFPDAGALADAIEAIVATSSAPNLVVPPTRSGLLVRRSSPRSSSSSGSIVIVLLAAGLGVVAVLGIARFAGRSSKSTAQASPAQLEAGSGSGRTTPTTTVIAPTPEAGSASAPDVGPGSGAIAPTAPPRSPSTTATAVAASGTDPEVAMAESRRALMRHDAKACSAALANVSFAGAKPMTRHSVDWHRAQCEMAAGDCDGGLAHARKAYDAMGMPVEHADSMAMMYCPIAGDIETRVKRLSTQVHLHKTLVWCEPYVAPVRLAIRDARSRDQKSGAEYAARELAQCLGNAGKCDEAADLWELGNPDGVFSLEVTGKCASISKGPATAADITPTVAASNPAADLQTTQTNLAAAQQAIQRHDARACLASIRAIPIPIHTAFAQSVAIIRAHCEMMAGDCNVGAMNLTAAYSPPGISVGTPTLTATIQSSIALYCPVTGDLDTRLTRLLAKLNAFSSRGSHSIAWCNALIAPARKAGDDAQTDHHRTRAGVVLARLATCVGFAGRCADARKLWDRAVAVDGALAGTTPDLAQCP